MINIINDFYSPSELGLMTLCFLNYNFSSTYQSKEYVFTNRSQACPCYETDQMEESEDKLSPYQIFKNTFESKTNIKILKLQTFLRKTKLEELKNSAVWKKDRPHRDSIKYDLAGLIYFNSNCLKDGTNMYNTMTDFEPTAVVGSRVNRCVFYSTQQPHSPTIDQTVEERWVQPFFIVYKKETLEKV